MGGLREEVEDGGAAASEARVRIAQQKKVTEEEDHAERKTVAEANLSQYSDWEAIEKVYRAERAAKEREWREKTCASHGLAGTERGEFAGASGYGVAVGGCSGKEGSRARAPLARGGIPA